MKLQLTLTVRLKLKKKRKKIVIEKNYEGKIILIQEYS